jgi:hypothetical protein
MSNKNHMSAPILKRFFSHTFALALSFSHHFKIVLTQWKFPILISYDIYIQTATREKCRKRV